MNGTTYDEQTALLVVDVQNDFADPSGNLSVRGGADVVGVANREVARATAAGSLVVYSRDWHPARTPHFERDGGVWPVHCVRETWGAAFHPALSVTGPVIDKATGEEDGYSAFSVTHLRSGEVRGTGLEELLREHGVRRLVIVGLATDYCVHDSARDAIDKGFEVVVLRDGVRAVDLEPGDGDRALTDLEARGVRVA